MAKRDWFTEAAPGVGGVLTCCNGGHLVVYRNSEIIRNTHEGVRFVYQNPFLFVVPCTRTLIELQNGLC
ncbi:hypothetical protein Ahy_B05g079610 isoform B [Arachis hypogaea]|uniref:Uncharacterized protein n=1 Tax=Arachis hypogaea TaxID=3818 RepID=A0A444ZAC0_ARAHY|nr:hypothetical protein Ahy_B05g079610 isoform B [Arachis hypogaea]